MLRHIFLIFFARVNIKLCRWKEVLIRLEEELFRLQVIGPLKKAVFFQK